MHMMPGYKRYDAYGKPMVYELPFVVWGEGPGGRDFQLHMNKVQEDVGLEPVGGTLGARFLAHASGGVHSVTIVDDVLLVADAIEGMTYAAGGINSRFEKMTGELWPRSYNGMKLTWFDWDSQTQTYGGVTCAYPQKILALVSTLGGIDVICSRLGIDPASDFACVELTSDELHACYVIDTVLSPAMIEMVRSASGMMQYISPLYHDVKVPVHVVSRVQSRPTSAALRVCDKMALMLTCQSEIGLTFGGGALTDAIVGESKHTHEDFMMDKGAPAKLIGAYDATWDYSLDRSVESSAFTFGGAAVDVAVHSIPGQPFSSFEGEAWAQSTSQMRGVYIIQVVSAFGFPPDGPVEHLGDNSMAVKMPGNEVSVSRSKYMLRRLGICKALDRAGVFTSAKVPTDQNFTDFLGKWVPKEKREASKAFTQGTRRMPPMEVLLADSGQKVPIPGVSFG
jgi:hypothetical protein